MGLGQKAANIHRFMCENSGFGYSWEERWGGPSTVVVEGVTLRVGDYDCSSSTITAWKKALEGTAYAGCLDDATYTGNMRSVFTRSGLFEWKPMSFLAEPGDLYLNEGDHVAMCQTQYPDILSEFSINEFDGVYGGQRGDQTGWESHLGAYYDYPWNGILHYNGKADSSQPAPKPSGKAVCYRVSADPYPYGCDWYDEMQDWYDTGGSGDDFAGEYAKPIRWLAIKGCKYRVHTERNGWLPWVDQYNIYDLEYGCAGDGSRIDGIEVDDSTVRYAVHVIGGGWYDDMIGRKDTGGSTDTYAGDLYSFVDIVRMRRI